MAGPLLLCIGQMDERDPCSSFRWLDLTQIPAGTQADDIVDDELPNFFFFQPRNGLHF